MKTITGSVVSSKPISLSKAASTLSSFLSAENGASQALCAYLRRASASFNELKQLHKELNPSRSDRKHRNHRSEASNDLEAAVDNPYFEDVVGEDGKRNLKAEIEDKPSRRVEIDVESSDRDKSVVAVEKKRKNHKKKSEDAYGKIGDDNNGEIETAADFVENNAVSGKDRKKHEDKKSLSDEKDQVKIEGQSTNKNNDDAKKKKKNKDADDLQINGGRAIVKEEIPVSDSNELKRKERKRRKNRDLEEEGGDDGSEEQQGTKRRKGNL